ncbi:MAG: hypothetical protein DRP79_09160 [Planctomycetota bacterium]|nr:MAG: hypothetical protein DRP79_09160 [Planctomycetota bacterium]
MSMFGTFIADSAGQATETLPDMEEWPESTLLKHEKESLGFYVTSHPLARYEDLIRHFSTVTASAVGGLHDGSAVTMGCIVHNIKRKVTRNGKAMALAELEDLTGNCKAIFWPKTYDRFGSLMEEDAVVFVRGKVDAKGEEAGVIVSEVIPIEDAYGRLTRSVRIKLNCVGLEEETLQQLKRILSDNAGECPVVLEMREDGQKTAVMVDRQLYVLPSRELVAAFDDLLGPGRVVLN